MPGYFRRGRNPSNPYGRRYWRRTGWWRRFPRSRGRVYTSGRRRQTLRVPVEAQVQFTINAGDNWSTLGCIQPYVAFKSTHAGRGLGIAPLVFSPLYRRYTELYDEVKVDSVNVSGSIIDGIGIGGTFSGLSFCSSWDRKIQPGEIIPGGTPGVTPRTIQFGSESQSFLLTNNSRQLVHRWNRASDLQERTVFHDCSVSSGSENSPYAFFDAAFFAKTTANELVNSTNVGYVPGLWMAFYSPLVDSVNARQVNVTFKVVYTVTFRNPKYGLSAEASAAKGAESIVAEPVKVEGAGKSVAKTVTFDAGAVSDVLPTYNGLLGGVVDRLSANMHEEGVYSDGEYDHDEDIQFGYEKLGDEVFHQLFKNVYDDDLKKFGLISEKDDVVIKEA